MYCVNVTRIFNCGSIIIGMFSDNVLPDILCASMDRRLLCYVFCSVIRKHKARKSVCADGCRVCSLRAQILFCITTRIYWPDLSIRMRNSVVKYPRRTLEFDREKNGGTILFTFLQFDCITNRFSNSIKNMYGCSGSEFQPFFVTILKKPWSWPRLYDCVHRCSHAAN